MQNVIDGVSGMNTDSICESQEKFFGAVRRLLAMRQRGGRENELVRKAPAKVERKVGHCPEIGHAAAVDPAEYLVAPERVLAAFDERGFERRTFQLREIGATWFLAGHDRSLPCYNVFSSL